MKPVTRALRAASGEPPTPRQPRVRHAEIDIPGALPLFVAADAAAIKAWAQGTASPEQQKRAFNFVVYQLAGIGKLAFHPGDSHATAFKDGRRSVGVHLAHLVATPLEKLKPTTPRGPDA